MLLRFEPALGFEGIAKAHQFVDAGDDAGLLRQRRNRDEEVTELRDAQTLCDGFAGVPERRACGSVTRISVFMVRPAQFAPWRGANLLAAKHLVELAEIARALHRKAGPEFGRQPIDQRGQQQTLVVPPELPTRPKLSSEVTSCGKESRLRSIFQLRFSEPPKNDRSPTRIRAPMRFLAPLAAAACVVLAGTASAAEPVKLIVNGDFSLSHPGTTLSGNQAIPDYWNNIQTQTVNALVLDGAMMFSTAHPTTNVNLYKDYIWQSFNVADAGEYTLTFDYKLQNAQNGAYFNGAKLYVDQFYASAPDVVPNLVFQQTYVDELLEFSFHPDGLNQWHLGQTVSLSLGAGTHTLYLSSGTGDFINQYGARVWFDNVAITSAVPEPGSAALWTTGLLAWAARARSSASRRMAGVA